MENTRTKLINSAEWVFADIPNGFGMLSFLPGCSLEFLAGEKEMKKTLLLTPKFPKNQQLTSIWFAILFLSALFLSLVSLCPDVGHPLLDSIWPHYILCSFWAL